MWQLRRLEDLVERARTHPPLRPRPHRERQPPATASVAVVLLAPPRLSAPLAVKAEPAYPPPHGRSCGIVINEGGRTTSAPRGTLHFVKPKTEQARTGRVKPEPSAGRVKIEPGTTPDWSAPREYVKAALKT